MRNTTKFTRRLFRKAVVAGFGAWLAMFCLAQERPARRPAAKAPQTPATAPQPSVKYKGIWEPVSYPDDVRWFDVFFATADEGWAAGGASEMAGGIIIHTADGGDHWDVQYGDLQSSDRAVKELRFLDQTHGWAVQRTGGASRLLHTRDGKLWLLAGTIDPHHFDYMFTSETNGVMLGGSKNVGPGGGIKITRDGGRSWNPVFDCAAKIQVNGLWKNVLCIFRRLQFVTPSIAYAIGEAALTTEAPGELFLAKTSDGGASWSMTAQQLTGQPGDLFFLDENTGYARVGGPDTGQIYKTTDGGQNWTGMAASPGERIQFADPEVGWALHYNKVSFTTDGGDHWNSRQYAFPAQGQAFSLPRRDRGYVVGEHGMIYRYRIVPEAYVAKAMLPAPLLSGINSPLDVYVQKLAAQTQQIAADAGVQPMSFTQGVGDSGAAGASPGTAPQAGSAAAGGAATPSETGQTASPAGAFTQGAAPGTTALSAGFSQDLVQAESTFNSVSSEVPSFATKYRNLNLLLAGFAVSSQMPTQIASLKQSFQTLRTIRDPQAASAAVNDMQTKVMGLFQMVRMAFQKKGAPPASSFQQSPPPGGAM